MAEHAGKQSRVNSRWFQQGTMIEARPLVDAVGMAGSREVPDAGRGAARAAAPIREAHPYLRAAHSTRSCNTEAQRS